MALSSGTRLGPYRIEAKLGEGGMGEVYRARDTRLDRTVAIKVLPTELSADSERRARFQHEARAVAALSHPHICALYDIGEAPPSSPDGLAPSAQPLAPVYYLVMEHLHGETLADRLLKGKLPLDQGLTIATEIADALAAAHRQGIIHRDLKPGNVMLTKAGAKLLDFGLAKLKGHGAEPAAARLESAATRSAPLTAEGTIVGTLQYMAPEQVEGKPPDARTDIWALGAILYEMVTGTRAFEGASAASLVASIMNAEPPTIATLQPLTPPALERAVRKCLAKHPDDRWDTAHDVTDELRWIAQASGTRAAEGTRPGSRRVPRGALTAAAVLAGAAIGASGMWLLRPPPRAALTRLSLDVRPAQEVNAGGYLPVFLPTPGGANTTLTWTPDGGTLIFVGRQGGVQQIYARKLDAVEARPLAGTEGARALALSPDGQWLAFWAGGAIRRAPLGGGPVMDLAAGVSSVAGIAWDGNTRVLFGNWNDGCIWAIPAEGPPRAVTTKGEGEQSHVLPWPLPGGDIVLYTARRRAWSWGDEEVVAQKLASGERKVLVKDAADARYLPTGHLVFLRRGQLFAAPFDATRLELQRGPVAVLDGVAQALTAGRREDVTGAGQLAVSTTGTLAWIASPPASYPDKMLVTVDRRGAVTPVRGAPVRSYGPVVRVSPDGRQLAVTVQTLSENGVWLYDLGRGSLRLLAGGGEALFPVWSPDGRRLAFDWLVDGRKSLVTQPADATTPWAKAAAGELSPSSFAPDGRLLAAVRASREIVVATVGSAEAPVPFRTQAPDRTAHYPEFSPDGRWLAYASDASGRFEVYVQPYPGPGPAEPVSLEGGWNPAWNPTGRELFFLTLTDPTGKSRMMTVDFASGSPPRIGRPRVLFEFIERDLPLRGSPVRRYDVAPDGQRFYAVPLQAVPAPPVVTHVNLIQNWFEELKAKVPAR